VTDEEAASRLSDLLAERIEMCAHNLRQVIVQRETFDTRLVDLASELEQCAINLRRIGKDV
jgi:hypothetical protein